MYRYNGVKSVAYQIGVFDPEDRSREKQASRVRDERALREGIISRDDLRQENGFFSGFDIANSIILRRSVRVAE